MTEPWDRQPARRQDCTCIYLNVEGLGRRPLAWILDHEIVHVRFTDGPEETFASQGEAGGVDVRPEGIDTIVVIDDHVSVLLAEGRPPDTQVRSDVVTSARRRAHPLGDLA